jgi:hypothetical protein
MAYSNEVIEALATLRQLAQQLRGDRGGSKGAQMAALVDVLDNAGVFRAMDEQTGYAPAEEILETDQHGNSTVPDGGHEEYVRSMEAK